ncbi:hypothetical protein C1H46_045153 [Malus baccata]|uniref:Uncharacterized protein n=1 Tax=Malus baccata TaxID=106549 RepID=A0A540K514_MALBA|nr:hypothetical protein C1H46_045153 [Malus baccata]
MLVPHPALMRGCYQIHKSNNKRNTGTKISFPSAVGELFYISLIYIRKPFHLR